MSTSTPADVRVVTLAAVLASMPLGAEKRVAGRPVRRESLLGFAVVGEAAGLDIAEAAALLADLVTRVRGVVKAAATELTRRGITGGSLSVWALLVDGRAMARVAILGLEGDRLDTARRVIREWLIADALVVGGPPNRPRLLDVAA